MRVRVPPSAFLSYQVSAYSQGESAVSLEFLQRKKKAIDDAIEAYEAFQVALHELPPEWAEELRDGVKSLSNGKHQELTPSRELLSPTDAVQSLLRKHPEGLVAKEIIKELSGKVQTKSSNPTKLLYSILATLKRYGKLTQTDKRYRLIEAGSR